MVNKHVPVAGHIRQGTVVTPHVRTVTATSTPQVVSQREKPAGLRELAESLNPVGIVDMEGNQYSLEGIEVIKDWVISQAVIDRADFSKIKKIENCTFEDVRIKNVYWKNIEAVGCIFKNVKFEETAILDTKFSECSFERTKFDYCKIDRAEFQQSVFDIATFIWTHVDKSLFEECKKSNIEFVCNQSTKALLTDSTIRNCSFQSFALKSTQIRDNTFENSRLCLVTYKAELEQNQFTACDLQNSYLSFLDVRETNFHSCNFSKSSIESTNFHSGNITDTSFANSKIKKSVLSSSMDLCDFKGAKLNDVMYQRKHFQEVRNLLEISDRQFEFLVLSGVIEVRDNKTLQVVTGGFDPDEHHIPQWGFPKPTMLNG